MSNPFRHLTRNAEPHDISITAYNQLMDMLGWWQTNQARSGGPPLKGLVDWDQCVFKTKNTSGALVPTYGVVGLAGPLYGPTDNLSEFQNVTPMEGVEPVVADHAGGRWGVALEMIDNGCIGRCCFAGVVPTRVYINGADDGYCDIIEGETDGDYTCYLGTGATGAQILWREGGSAGTVEWAVVRLGNKTGPIPFQLKTSLTPGGTATAYLTEPDGTIIDESTPLVVTVTDTIGDKRAIGKDDRSAGGAIGLAEVLADGTVAIQNIHQQALLIKATAKAAISGSTGTVDNVTVRDRGMSPVAESSTELSVNNPLNYYVADDGVCLLEWNESSSPAAYDITGVVMTAVSPMTDWQYNDTSEDIEEKTRATRVNVAGDESGWTKIDDTEECQEAT